MDIVALFIAGLLFTFPGILVKGLFRGAGILFAAIVTVFVSLGFWVCISWFISLAGLPLSFSVVALLLLFAGIFFVRNRKGIASIFKARAPGISFFTGIPVHYLVLAVALLFYLVPLAFITIPPGCDTAMHGYISRLIVNSNGLPHSYRPILPVDYFGSYSAGYHVLTSLISGVSTSHLREAINLASIIVYPLALLGLIFFLKAFFSERTAIYTAIVFFGVNTTIEGAIGWGGNPCVLSFAFCLFSGGFVIYAIQNGSNQALYLSAIGLAAIPLIHAIPAVTFAYLSVPGFLILLYHYRDRAGWVISNTLILVACTVFLLFPFLLHFRNEHSPELLAMIKSWQHEMMGNKPWGNLTHNLVVTADQIKYRVGDVLVILAGISLAFLLRFRKYREVGILTFFIVYLYVLIFNYSYWFLPLSELLYPERVVYFMVVCVAMFFAYFLSALESQDYFFVIRRYKMNVYVLLAVITLCIAAIKINDNYITPLRENNIDCNPATRAAFEWINTHTEKDALFVASYADAGMWIPAFTNRATLGTHLHFIHLVQHVADTMEASKAPRYIFVTKRDIKMRTKMLEQIGNRAKVFSNEEAEVYH